MLWLKSSSLGLLIIFNNKRRSNNQRCFLYSWETPSKNSKQAPGNEVFFEQCQKIQCRSKPQEKNFQAKMNFSNGKQWKNWYPKWHKNVFRKSRTVPRESYNVPIGERLVWSLFFKPKRVSEAIGIPRCALDIGLNQNLGIQILPFKISITNWKRITQCRKTQNSNLSDVRKYFLKPNV